MIHTPEEARARRALVRCFLRNGIDREQWMADLVLPIVQEALEARDREIARLRAEIELLLSRLAALEDPL